MTETRLTMLKLVAILVLVYLLVVGIGAMGHSFKHFGEGFTEGIVRATFMVMGANIGTTITSTIVSLAHVTHSDEFRRSFAAATVHDFFNFLAVAILFPLELAIGYLTRISTLLASVVDGRAPLDSTGGGYRIGAVAT